MRAPGPQCRLARELEEQEKGPVDPQARRSLVRSAARYSLGGMALARSDAPARSDAIEAARRPLSQYPTWDSGVQPVQIEPALTGRSWVTARRYAALSSRSGYPITSSGS